MFNSIKEIATAIMDVALDTGYSYDYLCECMKELLDDGESYEEAFDEVSKIAYELDY